MNLSINRKVVEVSYTKSFTTCKTSLKLKAKSDRFCVWNGQKCIDNKGDHVSLPINRHSCLHQYWSEGFNVLILPLAMSIERMFSLRKQCKATWISHEVVSIFWLRLKKRQRLIWMGKEDVVIEFKVMRVTINLVQVKHSFKLRCIEVIFFGKIEVHVERADIEWLHLKRRHIRINYACRFFRRLVICHSFNLVCACTFLCLYHLDA